jgi:hypothetical protein
MFHKNTTNADLFEVLLRVHFLCKMHAFQPSVRELVHQDTSEFTVNGDQVEGKKSTRFQIEIESHVVAMVFFWVHESQSGKSIS